MHSAISRLSLVLIIFFTFHFVTKLANADVPRPRGVSLAKATLYQVGADNSWTCLDGDKTIRFVQINDDYCDCKDGSDEPGTSACSQGQFHCPNIGYRSVDIPSNRVNDGICDCCDGSDEYSTETGGTCTNTCQELGRAEQEQRKREAELHKSGATKRAEMITKGKQKKADREIRRAELDRRRNEQEAIKTEKEQLKTNAEAAEAEALELYKEQQRELDAAAEKTEGHELEDNRVEAEAYFVRYDVNKDGFVEVTELQVDMTLDRDRNGVVTIEEAKHFLDERDRIELNDFLALSWPRIKTIKMLADGLFKPPNSNDKESDDIEHVEDEQYQQSPHLVEGSEGQEPNESDEDHQPEHEEFVDEEEEEIYEDEDADADVGVGSVTPDTTKQDIEYDPETQRLIDAANEARSAYSDIEREIREIENEIKEIDEQNAKDYGPNEEYAAMDGECYTFEDREYVYTLCPFERASQKQRSGGSETTLGRWDQWDGENENKYVRQRYSHGASCWNGPQRSALVQFKCALEPKITSVTEPNRCEYFFEFETPAACDEAVFAAKDVHDEL